MENGMNAVTRRKVVRAPRAFLRSETPATLVQTKMLRAFMMLSMKEDGMLSGEYEMPINLFRSLLNLHDRDVMKATVESIRGKTFDWPDLEDGEGGWLTPIPNVKWSDKTGKIEWEVSRKFANVCVSVNVSGYTYLPWEILTKFSSIYALKIWELCMASVKSNGFGSQTPKWPIEVLRVKLGVPPDAYATTGPLLLNCVKKPLVEVLEIGGLDIEFAKRGHGKTAVYWFVINGKKNIQGLLSDMTGISSEVKRLDGREKWLAKIDFVMHSLTPKQRNMLMEIKELAIPYPQDEGALRSYYATLDNELGVLKRMGVV